MSRKPWWGLRPKQDGWTCVQRIAIEVWAPTPALGLPYAERLYYVRDATCSLSGSRCAAETRLRELFELERQR
jgi:hypothetical protein